MCPYVDVEVVVQGPTLTLTLILTLDLNPNPNPNLHEYGVEFSGADQPVVG